MLDEDGIRLETDGLRLRVSGEVDFGVAASLAAIGSDWLDDQATGGGVEFDLRGVTEVSSSALSVLLEWTRHARRAGLEVRAVHLSPPLARLTRLAGIDRLLPLAEAA